VRVGAAVVACMLLAGGCEDGEPLPRLGTLPSFALVDQHGDAFGRQDMQGRVWIASFVFTRCPTICPTLSMKMEELQRRFTGRSGEIALVSFSVDPENDTPAVLREHAARYHADPSMWTWVTGPTEQVSDTVVRGFRVAMGEPTPTGNGDEYEIMHSSHFVLVDRDGTIRGYYASDPEGVAELTAAAAKLVEEGR